MTSQSTLFNPELQNVASYTMDQMIQDLGRAFRSKRLTYRALEDTVEDKEFMYSRFMANPIMAGLSTPMVLQPLNRKASDERVGYIIGNSLLAVIILAPTDEPAEVPGQINVKDETEPSTEELVPVGFLNLRKNGHDGLLYFRSTGVGISIADEFQGRGYGREAINWALDWAFGYANLHRVSIGSVEFNERALALYRSIGFVAEGRTRKSCFFNMKWYDQVELSMLEDEYRALREIS